MARMIYIRQISKYTFLHLTTDGLSFRLRDYSQSPSSPPLEVMRQVPGEPELTADTIRELTEQPGNYNLDPPESRDLKDVEFWHNATIEYNTKYLNADKASAEPAIERADRHQNDSGLTAKGLTLEDVSQGDNDSLKREVAYYLKHRGEWHEHEGEHVLIRGEEVIGFFPIREAALHEGFRRFGRVAFLVKSVNCAEAPRSMAGIIL